MSYFENKRIALDSSEIRNETDTYDKLSVLYATPSVLSSAQSQIIQEKYSDILQFESNQVSNILTCESINTENDTIAQLPVFLQTLYLFCLYLMKMRTRIKSYHTLHLVTFDTASFMYKILPLIILGKFYRKNVIVEFFDFQNYYFPEESRMIVRYFLKICDAVIVPTHQQSRTLRQKKIKATTLVSKSSKMNFTPRVIEEVQPKILVAAPLEEIVNISCLLEAFSIVKQKYPRSELTIVGSGTQKAYFENRITSKHIFGVEILEPENIRDLYCEAEIFVHCYHIEYFAKEILQAMAHGIPVISSPLGMLNNLIQNDNILMYQYNDFSRLADHLLLLIENSEVTKKISTNSPIFVKNFTDSLSTDSVKSLYENLS